MTKIKLTRSQQKEQTKSEILEAALLEFSREGYDGSNIRAIASRAGVNHGLIKYHFGGKEELWKQTVGYMFERSSREIVFDESLDAREAIKKYIRDYTRYCARHPEHVRIMMQSSMQDTRRLRWAVENYLTSNTELMRGLIDKHKALGLWPDVSSVHIVYIVVAACQLIFALGTEVELLYGEDVAAPAFVDKHADAIITLLGLGD